MSQRVRPAEDRLSRHEFLARLHERRRPRTYLEVGVSTGASLGLSSVPSVGIDPAYTIASELRGRIALARTTSDDYFATTDPKDWLGGPVELAFIDGMHLFEYALRDFINVEKHCRWSSVVVLDDMLPRNAGEAARGRHTGAWTGDVFRLAEVLRTYRPDLTVLPVDTVPTGVVVVLGADPSSTVLQDHYDEIVAEHVHDDPQQVPAAVLRRDDAWDARALVESPVWGLLHRGDRPWRRRDRGLAELQEALHQPAAYRRRRRALRDRAEQLAARGARGRRDGTVPEAVAATPAPAERARALVATTEQAGVSSLRRLVLVSRGRRPALTQEIRALRPGVKIIQVDPRPGRDDVRLALATAGTLDAIIDVTTSADRLANRARELLPHVRKGGVLVLGDAAHAADVDALVREAGEPGEAETGDPGEAGPGDPGEEGLRAAAETGPEPPDERSTAILPTLARAGVHGEHVWLINGRRTWVKLREDEASPYLSRKGPRAGRVLHELPGAHVVRRSEVVESASDEAVSPASTYDAPPLQLREYENAISRRGQVVTQGRVVLPDSFRHLNRPVLGNHFMHRVDRDFAALRPVRPSRLEGVYFLLDSEFRGHFGHAMTEQLSRMWAWPEVKERYPDAKALVHTRNPYPKLFGWERRLWEAAGVAPDDLVLVDGPVRPDKLVAATPGFSQPDYVHPAVRDVYRRTGDALASGAPDRDYPERIFCSRRIAKRACHNTGEVESFFAERGFEVLFPEDYPLDEQVRLFRSARDVAGFGGSAMFNLAFATEPKRVFLVSAETYVVQNEAMIAAVNGHELHMAWCRADVPHGAGTGIDGRMHTPFTFDHDREGTFLRRVLDDPTSA
ncbi:hypothetical protein GCM10009809_03010 [Isoptericola hypogeus]|uniref:Glycosyltransferase 61 catalytic domain-containing protein n=1 Tax=Isoptericola hypogeus TaxID=300179 RepID=A0ABN2IRJ8_9MICO